MHDGRAIANFILDYCDQNETELTNLKLQKLVYFCHAWHLVSFGEPLIKHTFEAWEFGPVLPYLYRTLSEYKDGPISGRLKKFDPHSGRQVEITYELEAKTRSFLKKIVNLYSNYSAGQLVELSHIPNGPWYKVWNHDSDINPGMQISNEEIVAFYSKSH